MNGLHLILVLFIGTTLHSQSHDWQRTNPGGGGWFTTIGASKSGIVLAASDLSGAYRSVDGGQTWDVLGASRGYDETHVAGIGFHRVDGDIMFLGAENGIYKTSDGGDSWTRVLMSHGYVPDIEFCTDNPAIGYAANHLGNWNTLNAEIYKTTDTGDTWTQVNGNLPNTRILKLVVDPSDSNTLYALTGSGRPVCTTADVYKSTDGAVTWTNLTASQNFEGFTEVVDFAMSANDENILFITTVNADCANQYYIEGRDSKFYRSLNGGLDWEKLQDQGGAIHINSVTSKITLIETIVVAEWNPLAGVRVSVDEGLSFTKIAGVDNWENAFHGLTQRTYGASRDGYCTTVGSDLSNPDHFYWANSQWVLGSKNGGVTFEVLHGEEVAAGEWQSTGVDNLVNVDLAINEKNPNIMYLGLADMGIWRSLNKGATWENCNTADIKYGWGSMRGGNTHSIVSDPDRENVVWMAIRKGYILKSTDSGESSSWVETSTGLASTSYVNGLSIDVQSPINNRTLFATANGDVYKSVDDGLSWAAVLVGSKCNFTAVDRYDGNIVYAGGTKGLWRSLDGGSTWNRLFALTDLPQDNDLIDIRYKQYKGIYDIKTDPNHANWVYVTVFGYGENRGLYRSQDKGNSWQKLLEDQYMRKVAIMPTNSNVLYATSSSAMGSGDLRTGSNGIWFSNDGGTSWANVNDGMAYPFANAIAVSHEAEPIVIAGSQGTGFQIATVPVACQPIKFIDTVFGQGTDVLIQADDYIDATMLVESGARLELTANNHIEMKPNFEVEEGAIYHAYIAPCQNP